MYLQSKIAVSGAVDSKPNEQKVVRFKDFIEKNDSRRKIKSVYYIRERLEEAIPEKWTSPGEPDLFEDPENDLYTHVPANPEPWVGIAQKRGHEVKEISFEDFNSLAVGISISAPVNTVEAQIELLLKVAQKFIVIEGYYGLIIDNIEIIQD